MNKKTIQDLKEIIKEGGNIYNLYFKKSELKKRAQIKKRAQQATEIMSEKTKSLINRGMVVQRVKTPIYYFVSGFKKTALTILPTGEFTPSLKYPLLLKDKEAVEKFLGLNFDKITEDYKKFAIINSDKLIREFIKNV